MVFGTGGRLFRGYGSGVPEDDIQAYAWFSLASAQGAENAKKAIEMLTGEMTRAEIAEAQKLSRKYWEAFGPGLNNRFHPVVHGAISVSQIVSAALKASVFSAAAVNHCINQVDGLVIHVSHDVEAIASPDCFLFPVRVGRLAILLRNYPFYIWKLRRAPPFT